MTTYNSKSRQADVNPEIDELDRLINAFAVSGNDETAGELEEIKSAVQDLFDDLREVVDKDAVQKAKNLIAEQVSKFFEKSE